MKMLYVLVLVLLLPAVYSLEIEKTVYNFESCNSNISVEVQGTEDIVLGEYSLKDCSMVGLNKWFCECGDNYNLTLMTKVNTINNYTFIINYSYTSNSTTDLQEIEVKNNDITVNSIEYKGSVLYLVLESHGNKTVSIYTGSFGKPYKVYLNSNEVSFTYENNTVTFNASFSTNSVNLNYDYPSTAVSGSTGGGGGGGGGGAFSRIFKTGEPAILMMKPNVLSRIWINGLQHTVMITRIDSYSVDLEIRSDPIYATLTINESKEIDFERDGKNDLRITLNEIRGRIAFIEFENIVEESNQIINRLYNATQINKTKETSPTRRGRWGNSRSYRRYTRN